MYDSDLNGALATSPVSSSSLDQADPKLALPAADSFEQATSIDHDVTRHHQHGKWQTRAADKKDFYLGTFSSQEEAGEAYDLAAIKFRGLNAVTNSEISQYNIESTTNSSIPVGSMSGGGCSHKALESPPDAAMPVEARTAPLFAHDQQQQDEDNL